MRGVRTRSTTKGVGRPRTAGLPHPRMWTPLHRREVLRSLTTVSRTLCALCEITPTWRRVHIKNICHHVGHLERGDVPGVPPPDRGSSVPVSGVVENSARDPVRTSAQQRPDAPALIAGETVVTWAELDERVSA